MYVYIPYLFSMPEGEAVPYWVLEELGIRAWNSSCVSVFPFVPLLDAIPQKCLVRNFLILYISIRYGLGMMPVFSKFYTVCYTMYRDFNRFPNPLTWLSVQW